MFNKTSASLDIKRATLYYIGEKKSHEYRGNISFMLLSFEFSNFRSVKDPVAIDFRALKLKQHQSSLINGDVLPVTALYGPNGGGKSIVILAIGFLINLIMAPLNQFNGRPSFKQSYKPFMLDGQSRDEPTEFSLTFAISKDDPNQYRYQASLLHGDIIQESLYVKEPEKKAAMLFERDHAQIRHGSRIKGIPVNANVNPKMPYLSLLAIYFPNTEVGRAGLSFGNTLVLDLGNPGVEMALPSAFLSVSSDPSMKKTVEFFLSQMKLIDGYEVKTTTNPSGQTITQLETRHIVGEESYPLSYQDESMGTRKIIQIIPYLALAINLGNTLVIDELDAKMHPKLLEFLISIFTNPNLNKSGAQLIFTSHDMYTLSSKVFRRDEIYFACKNEEESTILYSLSDIKGDDNRMLRDDGSLSKNYLEGKYGSDPYYNTLLSWEDLERENQEKR